MPAKVRRALHVLAATALYYSGFLGFMQYFMRRSHGNGTYVLAFHRILSESEKQCTASSPGMVLGETVLAQLLDYIHQRMQPVSLETFLETRSGLDVHGRPLCLITFDDAWSDTATRAMPLLKERHISAIVFVPAGVVGRREGFWVEQLRRAWGNPSVGARLGLLADRVGPSRERVHRLEDAVEWLKRMPAVKRQSILEGLLPRASREGTEAVDAIMTWEQVTEVQNQGIEVGGHTVTHPLLTYEDDKTVEQELCVGRKLLEEKLLKPVRAFAYPNGDWDQRVREKVKEAGYVCAFTTEARRYGRKDDSFAIPRFLLHDGNVTGFRGRFSRAMLNMTLAGWA